MYKALLSSIAIGLTFIAFLPYIRSILAGKTKPHVFSWAIWGSSTFVVFLAQLADEGGAGAWPIGISGCVSIYIAFLAYRRRSDCTIARVDWLFLLLAAASLPAWYFTADPLWAVVILTTVDLLGFGPMLRNLYVNPHAERLALPAIMVVRNVTAIAALEHYSLTTVLFPAAIGAACLLLVIVVSYRRRVLAA